MFLQTLRFDETCEVKVTVGVIDGVFVEVIGVTKARIGVDVLDGRIVFVGLTTPDKSQL
jgi:hypothetical protein